MTVTERLRLELMIREQLQRHGDDFYQELARILERLQTDDRQHLELVPARSASR